FVISSPRLPSQLHSFPTRRSSDLDAIAHNAGINAKYSIHSAQLRDTYTPTSGFVNELSLNVLLWSHNESPLEPGVTLVYPSITLDRKSTRLNSSHLGISYAVFCLK